MTVFGHPGFLTDVYSLLHDNAARSLVANALAWTAKKSAEIRTLAHMTGTRRILKKVFGMFVAKTAKLTLLERYDLVVRSRLCPLDGAGVAAEPVGRRIHFF